MKILINLGMVVIVLIIIMYLIFRKRYNCLLKKILLVSSLLGAIILFSGIILNLYAINMNGGKMPVRAEESNIVNDGNHQSINKNIKCEELVDNYYLIFPDKGIYSIGDIIGALGFIIMLVGPFFILFMLLIKKDK